MERRRGPLDGIAMAVATCLGVGYGPIAPGTWGSIPGCLLTWAVVRVSGPWAAVAVLAVVTAAGLWAADRAAAILGVKDPGRVVVDEVAGQMLTLLFLPPAPRVLVSGFFLFRALDVWKPWPARALEAWPGGAGIMADDLAAGLYANLALHLVAAWRPGLLGIA